MKRTRRKYTRKPKPDALEPISGPVKEEGGSQIPPNEFSFNDLPLSIRMRVEDVIRFRKARGLPDDTEDRKALAVKMFRGDRPR